jgi:hypothetical protein
MLILSNFFKRKEQRKEGREIISWKVKRRDGDVMMKVMVRMVIQRVMKDDDRDAGETE